MSKRHDFSKLHFEIKNSQALCKTFGIMKNYPNSTTLTHGSIHHLQANMQCDNHPYKGKMKDEKES